MTFCTVCGVSVKFNTMRKLWVDRRSGAANTCHGGGPHNGRVFTKAEITESHVG